MAQQLIALVALKVDSSLIPSTHMVADNLLFPRLLMPSSGTCEEKACTWYTDIYEGKTLIHKKIKIKINKSLKSLKILVNTHNFMINIDIFIL